ncbi:MAG: hypothetical protein D3923_16505 [Candidatus Electrothrix sp. AR3]|nr:hypothetical protein [Candidatus Electrothrix sp. AR3]
MGASFILFLMMRAAHKTAASFENFHSMMYPLLKLSCVIGFVLFMSGLLAVPVLYRQVNLQLGIQQKMPLCRVL